MFCKPLEAGTEDSTTFAFLPQWPNTQQSLEVAICRDCWKYFNTLTIWWRVGRRESIQNCVNHCSWQITYNSCLLQVGSKPRAYAPSARVLPRWPYWPGHVRAKVVIPSSWYIYVPKDGLRYRDRKRRRIKLPRQRKGELRRPRTGRKRSKDTDAGRWYE
jgi:hypothetical protein